MKGVMKMKQIIALLLVTTLAFSLTACKNTIPASSEGENFPVGGNFPDAPKLILNGEVLDVYTSHYYVTEECAGIPLEAFLKSIGADYADSVLNEYGIQCYSFMGKRYIVVPDMHLFMLEDDYTAFLEKLDDEGKELSRKETADCGLLPKNESNFSRDINGTVLYWAEMWVDHISLMNALRVSGIDITIEYDYSNQTITVTLPKQ